MAGKSKLDTSPRTTAVVQVCLTTWEKDVIVAYAKAKHNGKVSIAARALLVPLLKKAVKQNEDVGRQLAADAATMPPSVSTM